MLGVAIRCGGHAAAVRLAELPDLVRGYEEIKLRNVGRFRESTRAILDELVTACPAAL